IPHCKRLVSSRRKKAFPCLPRCLKSAKPTHWHHGNSSHFKPLYVISRISNKEPANLVSNAVCRGWVIYLAQTVLAAWIPTPRQQPMLQLTCLMSSYAPST